MERIENNVRTILKELPAGVQLVVAGKRRTVPELLAAIDGGAGIIGENYLQEAQAVGQSIREKVKWHFIGHLQKNKVKNAVRIFDMIETVDSMDIACEIDKRSCQINKTMPVLIEINSGSEPEKSGVLPRDAFRLAQEISTLSNVRLMGLMTMGPALTDPEDYRPYFKITREIFEEIAKICLPNVSMACLSMGMSGSYKVAIEEGANLVRIGTAIFGPR